MTIRKIKIVFDHLLNTNASFSTYPLNVWLRKFVLSSQNEIGRYERDKE